MNKASLDIPSAQDGKWASYISKYPSDSGKVPANAFTANTRNLITAKSGQAEKIQGGLLWNPASSLGGVAQDQYEAIFANGTRLLLFNVAGTLKGSSGNNLFSTIQAGYNSLANFEFTSYDDRVYFDNGIDTPQVLDIVTSYGGVPYSFALAKTKAMGAQAPSSAPTVALVVDSTTPQVPAGAHTYKITFVYYNGQEESNGGPASTPVTNDATHTQNSLTVIPVGGYGVTARNIYRDNNDGNWLLLDVIPNNTATTYSDILPIGSTPTPIPTQNNLPPVFKYIANWLDRNFVAGVEGTPSTLYWSIAGEPDVFNPANSILCRNDDIITALFVFNGSLFVFGQHSVGQILGSTDGTFFYSPISTTVGCVDNRSIAVRSLISVPTMIWLSALPNRGFYYSNGSAVQFMSEFIDDLALNLSQVAFLERSNTQATQTAFEGDTSSPGIDLLTNPGAIQTINPRAFYGTAPAWLTGTIVDLVLFGDQLKNMLQFAPTLASGTLGGDIQISGTNLILPSGTSFAGESHSSIGVSAGNARRVGGTTLAVNEIAQPIIPPVSGTLLTFSIPFTNLSSDGTQPWFFRVYNDSFGSPGALIFSTNLGTVPNVGPPNPHTFSGSPGVSLVGGQKYWIAIYGQSPTTQNFFQQVNEGSGWTGGAPAFCRHNAFDGVGTDPWAPLGDTTGAGPFAIAGSYTYSYTPVADAGNWTSPVYDSLSSYNDGIGMTLIVTGSYPPGCSSTIQVQGSNSVSGPFTVTDTLSSPSGTISLTGGTYRYWQVIVTLNTSDNTRTPTVSAPVLTFSTTGTWSSPPIQTTSDIMALNSLVAGITSVVGTSFTLLIRTATTSGGLAAASYVPIGSAVPRAWAQVKLTMHTDAGDTVTAVASTVELDWTIGSQIESTPIDTAAIPPSGWGPFQFDSVGGGTTTVYFRTASTSGGLASATYIVVADGAIPSNTVFEWCQWKITFTATANSFPQVNSVTVNWFIGSGSSARCAATFFNKSYLCAAATKGSAVNNLLIEFDQDGNWRIHSAFNIATIGTYFNDLYYASALAGNVLNAFQQNTENGANISFDLRTKCFDYSDKLKLKIVRSLKVVGVGTNTLLHAYYSLDRGNTWVEMFNSSGTLGFQTPNDGLQFVEYFIPNFDGSVATSGRTVIYRLVSSDQYPCAILQLSPTVYVRKGKALREIMGS